MKTRLIVATLAVAALALPVGAKQKTAHVASEERGTHFVINEVWYVSPNVYSEVEVGSDYPARVSGKHVRMTVGAKSYDFAVSESGKIEPQPATVDSPDKH